jgi:hypothetical protein
MGMEFNPGIHPAPAPEEQPEPEQEGAPDAPDDVMAAFQKLQRAAENRTTLDDPSVIAEAARRAAEERAKLGGEQGPA